MEAARVAALRGHDVTLCEKAKGLGGQLLLAAKPPGREEIENLTRYLLKQMTKLNVKILLEQEVDGAFIEAFIPDAIILATGSVPMSFPGKEEMGDQLCFAHQALTGDIEIGRKVVVVGGGLWGAGRLISLPRTVTMLPFSYAGLISDRNWNPPRRWLYKRDLRKME